jgi:iron complex transport system substrate-binding protein
VYPGEAWSTPWREVITTVGTALGRTAEAADLLAGIDAEVAAQADSHPEFAGTTIAGVWDTPDAFYVYKPADARVEFTLDLGFESAPSVDALATDESTFYFTLSHQRLAELTSDVLVAYADTPELASAFVSSPAAQLMPQVRAGAVAKVTGPAFIASVSPPTALSLTWGLDEFVELLAGAVAQLG